MSWRRVTVSAALSGGVVLLLVAGCSREARDRVLPFFFDGVAREGVTASPPTRRVRRELQQEVEQLKRDLAAARATEKAREAAGPKVDTVPPAERARTWGEASPILAPDAGGYVDWVKALQAGVIAPRAGIDAEAREQAVFDLDVELARSGRRLFAVTYPHAPHTRWLTCRSCHPGIFPIGRGAQPAVVTMAKIADGQYCGACHGKVAFAPAGRCARCHKTVLAGSEWRPPEPHAPGERARTLEEVVRLLPSTAGGPDWVKALTQGVIAPRPGIEPGAQDQPPLPIDVERTPPGNPTFRVVFPHAAHTAVLTCTSCHPGIFQMAGGKTPITMAAIFTGQYCGVCHGKVSFAVPTGCPRCHPALAGAPSG